MTMMHPPRLLIGNQCVVYLQNNLKMVKQNNPEMGIDIVARQMHQKTVQHYWVNIVKQQVTGGGCPTFKGTSIQPMEAA